MIEEKKVEYIELFYDLIFVYCISRLTGFLEPFAEDFSEIGILFTYIIIFLCVIQIWVFTTFLMNRYGYRHVMDYVCIFINMFFLYIMAEGIEESWQDTFVRFHAAWAVILFNLGIQYLYRLKKHDCIDEIDEKIIKRYLWILFTEMVLALLCIPVYINTGMALSYIPLLFGMISVGASNGFFSVRPVEFGHLTERLSLFIVITFGETIVGAAGYFHDPSAIYYAVCVFLIVFGLFIIYIFDFYNFLDKERETSGILFVVLNLPLILSLNNFTVALETMQVEEIDLKSKSIYLMVSLGVYMASFFILSVYHKDEFIHDVRKKHLFAVIPAIFIVFCIVVVLTGYDPTVSVTATVIMVYAIFIVVWRFFNANKKEERMAFLHMHRSDE